MMEKRVSAFGGVFFKCQDKKALIEWYKKHLGLPIEEWGAVFPFSETSVKHPTAYNVFSAFPANTQYFEPSSSSFMFNFIVEDLDQLLIQLRSEGIEILGQTTDAEFGKFAWILDVEKNKIELWQPNPSTNE